MTTNKHTLTGSLSTMPNLYKFLMDGMSKDDYIFVYNSESKLFDIETKMSCTCMTIHADSEKELIYAYELLLFNYRNQIKSVLDPVKYAEETAVKHGLILEDFLEVLKNSIDYYDEYHPEKFI